MRGMGRIDWGARFTAVGGVELHSTRQIAEAMTTDGARLTKEPYSGARAIGSDLASSRAGKPWRPLHVAMLFGYPPKRKVLCSCGAIAEVDLGIASKKMSLGKALECRTCRNERIAREREELERHFSCRDEEDAEW